MRKESEKSEGNGNLKIGIIPAAGRGTRMLSLTDKYPKAMLPVNGRPLIGRHLDYLNENGFKHVAIIVGWEGEKIKKYVNTFYDKMFEKIHFIEQKKLDGLGAAIGVAMNELINDHYPSGYINPFIILGDTLIEDKLDFNEDFVLYSNIPFGEQERWCIVETENPQSQEIKKFHDKPEPGSCPKFCTKALIGVYNFTNGQLLLEASAHHIHLDTRIRGEIQLSSIMDTYREKQSIKAIESKQWNDFGQIDTYLNSKKSLVTRNHNSIVATKYNTVIKGSEDRIKLNQEMRWYLNIPNRMRVFTPQLIDFKPDHNYELEFIPFETVDTKFMYDSNDREYWRRLFKTVGSMINLSRASSSKPFLYDNKEQMLYDVLVGKTMTRMNEMYNHPDFKHTFFIDGLSQRRHMTCFGDENIEINGKTYNNIKRHEVDQAFNKLFPGDDAGDNFQIIHGDLFFGNMAFEPESSALKVFDPKGSFGKEGIYGDVRYDMAKLCNSIMGRYDFIVNDLFILYKANWSCIEYEIFEGGSLNVIEELFVEFLENYRFDKNQIYFITSMLFLSMLPIHKERLDRCTIFYAKAVEMFARIK